MQLLHPIPTFPLKGKEKNGSPHDNRFNRWVAGDGAVYFNGADAFSARMDALLADPVKLQGMSVRSRERFESAFTWPDVLAQYEALLVRYLPSARAS